MDGLWLSVAAALAVTSNAADRLEAYGGALRTAVDAVRALDDR